MYEGLLAIQKTISLLTIMEASENFENILINIFLPDFKPITLAIVYRSPDQSNFIDDFNIALNELAPQGNETYFLGDFNINLFFEAHYVLNKTYTKLKEAQSNQRLLKLCLEICWAFGLTQLINKSTRSYPDKFERFCNST